MIILGCETTAHTFGIGVVSDKGEVLANIKSSYSSPDKGMVPHEIAEHHRQAAEKVLAEALKTAKVSWPEIGLIAYSAGPGLDPALWTGYRFVKKWGEEQGKKLVGVNHCCSHLSIGKLHNRLKDPCYLYVSGVNTQVIVAEGGKYRVVGETLDIGLGNMLDKFGRLLGLGFPAGAKISPAGEVCRTALCCQRDGRFLLGDTDQGEPVAGERSKQGRFMFLHPRNLFCHVRRSGGKSHGPYREKGTLAGRRGGVKQAVL